MIPRIGRQGRSFRGAALYYLHDKDALTDERVSFTETRNLPTADCELSWRLMAAKSYDAERLKELSGVPRGGRKSTKPVWTMSLAWHPEQNPSREHMTHAMDSALASLGLQDHQAFYVAHSDTEHRHIHAVVSLIHPENGRTAKLSYSKLQLSRWSEDYEQEHGLYCELRVENNEKRKHWAGPKLKQHFPGYKPVEKHEQKNAPQFDLKAEVEKRYHAADSGRAFIAAMREIGYEVAAGNKRPVLVGPDGTVYSIARQLEGVKVRDVQKRLTDIELSDVDTVRGRMETARAGAVEPAQKRSDPVEYFDRDAQERQQDERIIDAGIRHDKDQALSNLKNRVQDQHMDDWSRFYDWSQDARMQLDASISASYSADERKLRKVIQQLQGIRWRTQSANDRLEGHRLTLQNMEQRKVEMRGELAARIEAERAAIAERQAQAQLATPRDLTPRQVETLNNAAPQAKQVEAAPTHAVKTYEQQRSEYLRRRAASRQQTGPDRDALTPPTVKPAFQRAATGEASPNNSSEQTYESLKSEYLDAQSRGVMESEQPTAEPRQDRTE